MTMLAARATRVTFGTLDGLRGVAAVIVLFYHLTPFWPQVPFPGSAFLSVDLFFMLSGFVIGHAYHERLAAGMGLARFVGVRFVRLYPLYLLGCLIGLATPVVTALLTRHWWEARAAMAALPWGLAMLPRFGGSDPTLAFPLNPPSWSLFYEMLVNIGYAWLFRHLSTKVLAGIVVASAVLLAGNSLETGSVGTSIAGWWGLTNLARPIFSFAMGLLLHRLHREGALPTPRAPAGLAVLLFLGLILAPASGPLSGLLSAMVVIVGFPLVLILGVANAPSRRGARPMEFAGYLSYPLYALHWPIFVGVAAAGVHLGISPKFAHLMAVPVAFVAAWLGTRFYDEPARAWAARRLKTRRAVEAAPAL